MLFNFYSCLAVRPISFKHRPARANFVYHRGVYRLCNSAGRIGALAPQRADLRRQGFGEVKAIRLHRQRL